MKNNNILLAIVSEKGKYPDTEFEEYAFCGRSNSGKSSLINSIFGSSKIAHVSSRPGKTATINFYNYKNKAALVDLPGYGFAKVNANEKEKWKHLIEHYLISRQQLKGVFIISDARRGIADDEISFVEWVLERGIAVFFVFTKIDKFSNNELLNIRSQILAQLSNLWQDLPIENVFFVSSVSKKGIEEIKAVFEEGKVSQ